ncbi:hypothetical protein HYH03_016752 [Edaphochlamys debaryana]|uniref:Uncharacterized protein n=1 Tax=Edaphochlamys debaryana TaxID=47281 RepID=A0A835XGY5_9CHLO|nr:hypothetical protein HYH03_016752 [Edaphochlamys debaryana]|eukprot:KAG2484442.1 hypothetical protein HYH03_016752 [Edaphochlamys debaryana]
MDRQRPPLGGGQRRVANPAGKFSAAQSHLLNDKYMDDFEKAWEEMHGLALTERGGSGSRGGGGGGMGGPYGDPCGGGGGGGGGFAAQQRSLYAALEDPSGLDGPPIPLGGGGAGSRAGSGRPGSNQRPSYGVSPSRSRIPARPSPGAASSSSYARGPSPSGRAGAPSSCARAPSPSYGAPPGSASAARGGPVAGRRAGLGSARSGGGGGGGGGGGWDDDGPFGSGAAGGGGGGGLAAARAGGPFGGRGGGGVGVGGAVPGRYPGRVVPGWTSGPLDPAGVLCDLSDRPNTCSAAAWARGEVVIGSTDHALYVLDAAKGTRKRTLYSKTCGHTEWVTCVCYTPDGRIVSGGMDSKLWVWPAGGVRGMQAEAHFGPISQVKYDPASGMVASASYDKTIRLWQLGARAHEAGCLQGHDAPVLEMQISADGRIASGDRSGHVLLWDTGAGGVSWRMRGAHQGHVTALAWFEAEGAGGPFAGGGGGGGGEMAGCFVTGGQDGCVRVWDPRKKTHVARVELHVNEQGRGAVGDIIAGGPATCGLVLTAGADGTVRSLDPRLGFALAATARLTDFPYSMTAAGGVGVVGCGDGSVHFVDVQTGDTLYALGANRAAVRCLEASGERLVTSGDDGNAVVYTFA